MDADTCSTVSNNQDDEPMVDEDENAKQDVEESPKLKEKAIESKLEEEKSKSASNNSPIPHRSRQ